MEQETPSNQVIVERIKNLSETMNHRHKDLQDTLNEILVQTKTTNGRVTRLETDAAVMSGKVGLLAFIWASISSSVIAGVVYLIRQP